MKPEEMRDDIPMDVREALEQHIQFGGMEALMAAIRPKPRTVHLPAADLPAPLEEVPESGEVFVLCAWAPDGLTCLRGYAKAAKIAVNEGMAYATQADAEAWLAHLQSWRNPRPGDDWTPHTPGDPMPCDGDAVVVIKIRNGKQEGPGLAHEFDWCDDNDPSDITAWRYAREGEA